MTVTLTVQQEANTIVTGAGVHHHPHHPHRHHQHHRQETIQEQDDDGGGGGGGSDSAEHRMQMRLGNFLLIDYLNDGERERRVSWNGVIGKETSLADSR
uniref:Uncharacterized protein n=1 Tax=Anopheles dirus TaxID=7168 RepID=A0A182MXR8_9DIPT